MAPAQLLDVSKLAMGWKARPAEDGIRMTCGWYSHYYSIIGKEKANNTKCLFLQIERAITAPRTLSLQSIRFVYKIINETKVYNRFSVLKHV